MKRLGQELRRFGPKKPDHPSVGETCIGCDAPFEAGDYTTLIATVPASGEDREKMEAGRPHNREAVEVHWTCASRLPLEAPTTPTDSGT